MELIEETAWEDDPTQKADMGDVPPGTRQAIRHAINGGAVFQHIQGVDAQTRARLEATLKWLLLGEAWSISEIAGVLGGLFGFPEEKAEAIARSEVVAIANDARERVYRAGPIDMEEARFEWLSVNDSRRTKCCEHITERTEGGVTMDELVRIEREEQAQHFPKLTFRRHLPHPQCRSTFVEV